MTARPVPWHEQFPDQYARLTPDQQAALNKTLDIHALSGMHPDLALINDLVDRITGVIDDTEYDRRADIHAATARTAPPPQS